MRSLVDYFGCGNVYSTRGRVAVDFKVTRFSDFTDKVIPFFHEHPILGNKALDFADWCKVAELMKENKQGYGEQGPLLLRKKYPLLPHLTPEGLEKIEKIKVRIMNKSI